MFTRVTRPMAALFAACLLLGTQMPAMAIWSLNGNRRPARTDQRNPLNHPDLLRLQEDFPAAIRYRNMLHDELPNQAYASCLYWYPGNYQLAEWCKDQVMVNFNVLDMVYSDRGIYDVDFYQLKATLQAYTNDTTRGACSTHLRNSPALCNWLHELAVSNYTAQLAVMYPLVLRYNALPNDVREALIASETRSAGDILGLLILIKFLPLAAAGVPVAPVGLDPTYWQYLLMH